MRHSIGFVPLFVLAMQSLAAAADSGSATPSENACKSSSEVQQRQCASRLAAGIRIARARADAKMLEEQVTELDDLVARATAQETSTGSRGLADRVCDVDCTIERASARLFRATTYPLLSTKPMSPNTKDTLEAPLLGVVMDGLKLVEHGLQTLPRRKGTYDASAKSGEAAFQGYLEGLAALSALKVRLLMAGGDLWYRMASANTIRTVAYSVGGAIGVTAETPRELEIEKAQAFYEEAFWAVVEAQTGVPAKESYGSLLLDLRNLQADLSLRLDSVRKGLLFLDVDPDQQTRWTLLDVGNQLQVQATAFDGIDSDVTARVKEWADRKAEYAERDIDFERYASSKTIEAEVYRLAEIQNVADTREKALEKELDELDTGLAKIDDELRADQIVAAFDRERLELKNDLSLVSLQTTQDLLALNKESLDGQLELVGARIEKTLADYNFEMQRRELEQRLISLKAELDTLQQELAQIAAHQEQLTKRREIETQRIAIADSNVAQLHAAQGNVFAQHKAAMEAEIAGVAQEIGYLEGAAGKLDAVCRARSENKTLEGQEWGKVKDCLQAGCSGFPGLVTAYQGLFGANKEVINQRRAGFTRTVSDLHSRMAAVRSALSKFTSLKNAMVSKDQFLMVAESARAVTSAAAQYIYASIAVENFSLVGNAMLVAGLVASSLDAAANIATTLAEHQVKRAEWNLEEARFTFEANDELKELEAAVHQAETELSKLDAEAMVEEWSNQRFLAEVGLELKKADTQVVLAKSEKSLAELECDGDKLDLERSKAKQAATKQVLIAQLSAKQADNALLTYDIQEQRRLAEISRLEIQRLEAESRELSLEAEQTQTKVRATTTLARAVEDQMAQVAQYRSAVSALAEQQQTLAATKQELTERIKAGVVAIADERKQFVLAALQSAEAAAKQQLSRIASKVALYDDQSRVRSAMLALEGEVASAVTQSHNRMGELIQKDLIQQEQAQSALSDMFWDFEGLLSKITRGMPEVLERKRGLIENVNYWYNIYRNRYRLLSSFASDIPPDSNAPVYLATADDIRKELGSHCVKPGQNEICRPASLASSNGTIVGQRVVFTLDRFDGLVVELADQGVARFEVSPYGGATVSEPGAGGRVLWTNNLDRERALHLLDVAVFADGCVDPRSSYRVTLTHLGFGTQVRRSGDTTLVEFVGRGSEASAPLVLLSDADLSAAALTFDGKSVPLIQVEELIQGVHDAGFPLFGYPMVGVYELRADQALRACLLENRPRVSLKMVFAN